MKKFFKILGYILLFIILVLIVGIVWFNIHYNRMSKANMALAGDPAPVLQNDGFEYRDLNKNGELDTYEDKRQPLEVRVEDLVSQMNVEEKAGMLFHTMIGLNKDGSLLEKPSLSDPFTFMSPPNSLLILKKHINHFNIFGGSSPKNMATWHNNIQKLAERTRLGIPITISSDPRNHFTDNPLASAMSGAFSAWCEPIGLGAIGDSLFIQQFGAIAQQEYRAVGIRTALHPMADLATEPRWGRINGSFGEDAELSKKLTAAYVRGFQGDSVGINSVLCMTKHFSGGGPQEDGWDAHFRYGKDQVYPGDNFDYHTIPFEGAFEAGTAQIMPYYGIPNGQTSEDVGFGFNKDVITGLLRTEYGFDGVVCTDWSLLTDKKVLGRRLLESTGWGVDDMSPEERIVKSLEAGVDQFGGENVSEMVVKLVKEGKLSEKRLDESVRRILRDKFRLGLFESPYVDVEQAGEIVGKAEFKKMGELSQRKSMVLLKNDNGVLPLKRQIKVYAENVNPEVLNQFATFVETPEEADFAILRLKTPFYKRPDAESFLENMFHQGDLDFKDEEKTHILEICEKIPTVIDIYLDRPAVIPEIAQKCVGLVANFGASDKAVLDVLFGDSKPEGKLPFELPSSMEAVRNQKEDMPYDSENPLFPFGLGLSY